MFNSIPVHGHASVLAPVFVGDFQLFFFFCLSLSLFLFSSHSLCCWAALPSRVSLSKREPLSGAW